MLIILNSWKKTYIFVSTNVYRLHKIKHYLEEKMEKSTTWTKLLIFTIIMEFTLACYLLYSGQYPQALCALSITFILIYNIFESISKKDK